MRVLTVEEAAGLIPDGATIAISGGGYRVTPEALLASIERRYLAARTPNEITVVTLAMLERSRAGKGGAGTGLNRLAKPGLMRHLITSSFSRTVDQELSVAIRTGVCGAINLPMGTVVQWLRAIGAGHDGLLTDVGLHTFVDPRSSGGRVNDAALPALSSIVEVNGREHLFYPRRSIDVALIKGSTADARGNIYLDREAFDHGIFHTAMAAKNSGGLVIAQVNRLVPKGAVHPRFGSVPAAFVDVVCVDDDVWEDEQDPALLGPTAPALLPVNGALRPRDVIARRALMELPPGAAVNLGAGIPMYDIPTAGDRFGRSDLQFFVEQGPAGGTPGAGGVSRAPELILESLQMFDFYEGGGPDASCLAFGEIDALGDVNVSRLGTLMPGCGGFPNIAHGARRLILCGTLTAGGLKEEIVDGRLKIITEGSIRRLVDRVQEVTYDGRSGRQRGTEVTIVTERGVFDYRGDALVMREIAPGVDLERDVKAHIEFDFEVDPNLSTMPSSCFTAADSA